MPLALSAASPSAPSADAAELLAALLTPAAAIEFALTAGCLLLAAAIVALARGRAPRSADSVWFGRRIVDGVFFPLLALALALLAQWLLERRGVPPAVFRIVLPVLLSLVVIRLTVRVLRRAFPTSALMHAVERSVSWIAWLAVVLWITGLLPLLLAEMDSIRWAVGKNQVTLKSLVEGAATAVVVLVLALWLSATLEARLLAGASDNLSIRKMAANAIRALLLFVALLFALGAAGIDLTALGVLGGAVGVGIGFGLQKLASNYISGFVILAERSVRIGDMVVVDGFEGRVTDIKTRYTVIRALNGRESVVPNEMLITERIENASLADPKVSNVTVVTVAYGTDLERLMPRIVAAVRAVPRVIDDPEPTVLLTNFAADGLELTVYFWIADPERGLLGVRSQVNLALLALLDELGVEIPYPQRVLRRAKG